MGPSPTANVREDEGVSSRVSFRFSPRFVPSVGAESLELETLRSAASGLISERDRLSILMELDETIAVEVQTDFWQGYVP